MFVVSFCNNIPSKAARIQTTHAPRLRLSASIYPFLKSQISFFEELEEEGFATEEYLTLEDWRRFMRYLTQ